MNSMICGRWDVTVHGPLRAYSSWFQFTREAGALRGRFVGIEGSARNMTEVNFEDGELYFRLPPQYEKHKGDLIFKGRLVNGHIEGETNDEEDNWIKFSAVPAPPLKFKKNIAWGEPQALIQESLDNWTLRFPNGPNGWRIEDNVLSNFPPSTDLVTKEKFKDFNLHAEFRIPKNGNSGIYLRGRYEIQIADDHNKESSSRTTGSVYGYLTPSRNMTKPQGMWNTYDITLVGRWLTLVFNGETVINNQEIPGLTGGAIDSNEGEPGPIMLQGDHKAVEYRNLVIRRSL